MKLKLLQIDALNIIRRCYEANPAPDSDAKALGALRSSGQSIKRALREYAPTHAYAAFDHESPNWRHTLYERYRAGRKPMPQELRAILPAMRDLLETLRIASDVMPGWEADDLLNAGARKWSIDTNGADCVVLSTDKDITHLLTYPGVQVRDHFSATWRDEQWVLEKFGVTPDKILDLLAIMGDAVDGIPGVTKVGVKTAAKLLNQYGDLEGILSHVDEIPGKLGKTLKAEQGMARLSRQLTAMDGSPELVRYSWDDLKLPEVPVEPVPVGHQASLVD